jgi:hypothetical protein
LTWTVWRLDTSSQLTTRSSRESSPGIYFWSEFLRPRRLPQISVLWSCSLASASSTKKKNVTCSYLGWSLTIM